MHHPTPLQKLRLFLLFAVAYGFLYVLPNFFPLFPPVYLPLLPVDRAVPLVPWTFLIYLSDYLLVGATILTLKRGEEWNPFARMCFGTLFLCGMFFIFFPTIYPRPPYPEEVHPLLGFLMGLVEVADRPTNCFPSMHVAMTAVATWSLRFRGPWVRGIFTLWALAIFVSTLTTKQHYFVDILGGLGATAIVVTAERWLSQSGLYQALRIRLAGTRQG